MTYADYWIQDSEYRDTDTGEVFDRSSLNAELEKMEKPAGIANPKDFRNEVVKFALRTRAQNGGRGTFEELQAMDGEEDAEGEVRLRLVAEPQAKHVELYQTLVEPYRKCEDEVVRLCGV